jgi:hypothetical protein
MNRDDDQPWIAMNISVRERTQSRNHVKSSMNQGHTSDGFDRGGDEGSQFFQAAPNSGYWARGGPISKMRGASGAPILIRG